MREKLSHIKRSFDSEVIIVTRLITTNRQRPERKEILLVERSTTNKTATKPFLIIINIFTFDCYCPDITNKLLHYREREKKKQRKTKPLTLHEPQI